MEGTVNREQGTGRREQGTVRSAEEEPALMKVRVRSAECERDA